MLSWIPLLGPILQGLFSTVTSIVNSFNNLQISKVQAEVTTEQTAAQIIHYTNDDILLRIIRDVMITPAAAWYAIGGWDTIIAHSHPEWRILVSEFPPQMAYYPYAVLVFLLGNIGINAWKNR